MFSRARRKTEAIGLPAALPREGRASGACDARSLRRLMTDSRGIAALEFAILSPVLLTILLGLFAFGIAMKDYLVVTSASAKGALTFALSRGTAAPYSATRAAIFAAAPTLTQSSLTITVAINNVACSTDSGCSAAMVAGRSALVTAVYPCALIIMGRNFAPGGCHLTGRTAQMIQ